MKRTLGLLVLLAVVLGISASAAAASSPSVTTEAATQIKDQSAVLNGRVNPNGSQTSYWFEWGLTSSYGSTSTRHSVGHGTAAVAARVTSGHLLPGTRYHYRLFAQNGSGLSAGTDHTFKTTGHPLPGVITGSAISVSQSGATLTGTVVPNNQATQWEFQYGTSSGLYGVTTVGGTVPASNTPVTVTQSIAGLQAGTTFHYRLVGGHKGFASTNGLDQTFTTFPAVRPFAGTRVTTRPHRARTKPFVFTTTGTVVGSPSFPSTAQCNGVVALRYFLGRRLVAMRLATVQPNCTFSHQATFRHTFAFKVGHKRPLSEALSLLVRFRGNNYLAPKQARSVRLMLR